MFQRGIRFEGRAHRKSVDARHVRIEKYEVRIDPLSELQRVFAGLGEMEISHIRQSVPQDQNGGIVIVDDQKSWRLPARLSRCCHRGETATARLPGRQRARTTR
jgi:hypothetical protein